MVIYGFIWFYMVFLLYMSDLKQTCILTCICLTAGVNLLTPSGHRQIRDVITKGNDVCGRRMRKGGGVDHTSVAALTNQLCWDRGVVRVFELSTNEIYVDRISISQIPQIKVR